MTVGDRIRNRRIELDLTQEEFAKRAGYCSKTVISRFEHSGNEISMKQINKLAKALDCSMAYLMGWETSSDTQVVSKQEEKQPKEEGFVNMADIPKAMELFEKYQNATPEVRAAIELLLKSPQSDA